jgi:hypothetical protein
MQKPDLDRLWRIKIYLPFLTSGQAFFKEVTKGIASQVAPLVSVLQKEQLIDWYYFLIHGEGSSVYFDVVVSLKNSVTEETLRNCVQPLSCGSTPEKLPHGFGKSIGDITTTQLRNDDILEAWKLIGEQSEWVLKMVNAHKEGVMTIEQFKQFMHFFTNALGLGFKSFMTVDGEVYDF